MGLIIRISRKIYYDCFFNLFYPGVAAESVYKSLQRKPNLVLIVDQPSTRSSFPDTHSPINFYSGSLTKIGLRNSRIDKLTKDTVGELRAEVEHI